MCVLPMKDSTTDQISCDTKQTAERKFSNLETEVKHTDIRASATSDLLPEYACDHHGVDSGGTDYYGTSNPPQECDWNFRYCPKCGEKL